MCKRDATTLNVERGLASSLATVFQFDLIVQALLRVSILNLRSYLKLCLPKGDLYTYLSMYCWGLTVDFRYWVQFMLFKQLIKKLLGGLTEI